MESDQIIKLNVGGHLFSASVTTLTKDSESMLYAMFSGKFPIKEQEDGSVFIDRDGTHFRHVLNFLRGSFQIPSNVDIIKELLEESEFYQIKTLSALLRDQQVPATVVATTPIVLALREELPHLHMDFKKGVHSSYFIDCNLEVYWQLRGALADLAAKTGYSVVKTETGIGLIGRGKDTQLRRLEVEKVIEVLESIGFHLRTSTIKYATLGNYVWYYLVGIFPKSSSETATTTTNGTGSHIEKLK
eukprot:TRINITY_DN3196_c0_g1_i1.p1 TRINITY_DN3196_c0_g1~~TRINITY_DN3196_c0_g1_i1.p1  ORF type:complete len:275 (-),score=22.43 TRINITY_DN3196_c0_g1_i1:292-1026(-)